MSESSSERQHPEVGLVPDEDLPGDLQPTDDNPLAKDPDDAGDSAGSSDGTSDGSSDGGEAKVEGMPDMGNPTPG